ncbi:MAG: TraB/GumN family protein [Bacteroidia bacterium]|nr:TraB/GumN family protein [Bacteroidia bacterium]
MRKFLAILFLVPFFYTAQVKDHYPSLLWKISGKGLKKPSYLYGTMHVSKRVAYYLSDEFFKALKSVDVVGLETNPGEWMENMEKTGELSEFYHFNSNNSRNRNFYKYTFTDNAPDDEVLKGLLSYDPDIVNGLLYRQHGSRENFEEGTYIDLFIYQSAVKLNLPVMGLEDFRLSEIYSRLSELPDEDEKETDYAAYTNRGNISEQIENAYRNGQLHTLDSLSKLVSSANTVKYLINERNAIFANTIDSMLQHQTLFSAVGAAHLPGELGLIELLRKKGYTVEAVMPHVTENSRKQREKLESQTKALSLNRYTAPDSAFTLKLPGKLYPLSSVDNIKYYLSADMVNGAFYSVTRVKHFGTLFQVSAAEWQVRIEKLLFENIPGKILSNKKISNQPGLRGMEIISQTRQGDLQRYQIYLNDIELMIFKVGGKGDYAKGDAATTFFSSLVFHYAPKGETEYLPKFNYKANNPSAMRWRTFSPATGGFTCSVPEGYSYEKYRSTSVSGVTEDLRAFDPSGKTTFGLKHAVFNDFNYLEEDTFELNQFAMNVLKSYKYTKETEYTIAYENQLPCIRFSGLNDKAYSLSGKVYIRGVHYYFAYAISQEKVPFEHTFFKQLALGEFKFIHPTKIITDKSYFFKAKDEVTDDAQSRFNELYANMYARDFYAKNKRDLGYDIKNENKYYYSPSSNECVNISFDKYNDYDFRDSLEMEERILKRYNNNSTFVVEKKHKSHSGGIFKAFYVLKDTATSRAIDTRIFIKGGVLLEINAPMDTLIGLTGWTKDFMDSFEPMDTIIGKPVFENKYSTLLDDLCSTDTVKRNMANISLSNSVSFQKAFTKQFVDFLLSGKLPLVSEESKAQLFVNGGVFESDVIVGPYKTLYKQYQDSFYLQLCLLKGLSGLKTKTAYAAFYELILSETPLVGSEATVKDVFATLHDSLELCKTFFPGLLALTKYDEYRDAVYSLMADLVNQKVVQPSVYAAFKGTITAEAALSLKRFNPSLYSADADNPTSAFNSLDKTNKELAENLKHNMAVLQNNRKYAGTQYLRTEDANARIPLVNYAIVLAPFYGNDAKVKQFFEGLYKTKLYAITVPAHIALLKQKHTLSDTLSAYYSKNKYTRAHFYSELEKAGLTSVFDKNYASQKHLVESVLAAQRQLNQFYRYDKDKLLSDSLVFVKELPVANKRQKGSLYLYRTKELSPSKQKWSTVFVQSGKSPGSNMMIYTIDYQMNEEKTPAEIEAGFAEYFSLGYRNRALDRSDN